MAESFWSHKLIVYISCRLSWVGKLCTSGMATAARRRRKHAERLVWRLESTAGVPKDCGKRLAAPVNLHLQ